MNGVLKILKPAGMRQQIVARCVRCSGYKSRQNNLPPDDEKGKFMEVDGKIFKVYEIAYYFI